jgi:hypothetical protein
VRRERTSRRSTRRRRRSPGSGALTVEHDATKARAIAGELLRAAPAEAPIDGVMALLSLADAIVDSRPLASYQAARDAAALPMYEFTTELASFAGPPPEAQALFAVLAGRPEEIARFFGVIAGATPLPEYFTPRNLARIIGIRGMAKMLAGRLRGRRAVAAAAA